MGLVIATKIDRLPAVFGERRVDVTVLVESGNQEVPGPVCIARYNNLSVRLDHGIPHHHGPVQQHSPPGAERVVQLPVSLVAGQRRREFVGGNGQGASDDQEVSVRQSECHPSPAVVPRPATDVGKVGRHQAVIAEVQIESAGRQQQPVFQLFKRRCERPARRQRERGSRSGAHGLRASPPAAPRHNPDLAGENQTEIPKPLLPHVDQHHHPPELLGRSATDSCATTPQVKRTQNRCLFAPALPPTGPIPASNKFEGTETGWSDHPGWPRRPLSNETSEKIPQCTD